MESVIQGHINASACHCDKPFSLHSGQKDLNACVFIVVCRFVSRITTVEKVNADSRHVLVTSLYGNKPRYTYGAVRNLQLHRILLSNWTVRIYMYRSRNNATAHLAVPELVVNKLRLLGAQTVYVNDSYVDVDPRLWRYDVINDETIERFITFDVDSRLDEALETVAKRWLSTNSTHDVLCAPNATASKHGNSSDHTRLPSLFGAKRLAVAEALRDTALTSPSLQSSHSSAQHETNRSHPSSWGTAQNVNTATRDTTSHAKTVAAFEPSAQRQQFLLKQLLPTVINTMCPLEVGHSFGTLLTSEADLQLVKNSELFKGIKFDEHEQKIT